MSTYGTQWQETEALAAVVNEDEKTAQRVVADMLPGERRALQKACRDLDALIEMAGEG